MWISGLISCIEIQFMHIASDHAGHAYAYIQLGIFACMLYTCVAMVLAQACWADLFSTPIVFCRYRLFTETSGEYFIEYPDRLNRHPCLYTVNKLASTSPA